MRRLISLVSFIVFTIVSLNNVHAIEVPEGIGSQNALKYLNGAYKRLKSNKAFAATKEGRYSWSHSYPSVEEAKKVALNGCKKGNKSEHPCVLIDVNNERLVSLKNYPGFLEKLPRPEKYKTAYPWVAKSKKFVKNYKEKYLPALGNKAMAVKKGGKRWGWSFGRLTVEDAKKRALKSCGADCRIVDVNGAVTAGVVRYFDSKKVTVEAAKRKSTALASSKKNVVIARFKASCLRSAKKKLGDAGIATTYCNCAASEISKHQKPNDIKISAGPGNIRKIINACNAVAGLEVTFNQCAQNCAGNSSCVKSCKCFVKKIEQNRSIYEIEKFLTSGDAKIIAGYQTSCGVTGL